MAHSCVIKDTDTHRFIIDPITRALTTESKKAVLMKTDHNSERFTFELPRMIEGHDMSECNKVEVHYINIDSSTREKSNGIYAVDDFGVDTSNDQVVTCSWLISKNVTAYAGPLSFVVRYVCVDENSEVTYCWNTAIYSGVNVIDGICNTDIVVADYVDILDQWLNTLEAAAEDVIAITDDGAIINLTSNFESLRESITAEAEARESADTALGERIIAEAEARESADTALGNRITTLETKVGSGTGDGLSEQISTMQTDITNLKSADSTINTKINTINSDITSLKSADSTINTNINTINSDITNLKSADTSLSSRITTLENSVGSSSDSGESSLSAQVTTLQTEVTGLSTRVSNLEASEADWPVGSVYTTMKAPVESDDGTTTHYTPPFGTWFKLNVVFEPYEIGAISVTQSVVKNGVIYTPVGGAASIVGDGTTTQTTFAPPFMCTATIEPVTGSPCTAEIVEIDVVAGTVTYKLTIDPDLDTSASTEATVSCSAIITYYMKEHKYYRAG